MDYLLKNILGGKSLHPSQYIYIYMSNMMDEYIYKLNFLTIKR